MDSLGDRMKRYGSAQKAYLTRGVPMMVHLDGKAFHTFTKAFERPWDARFNKSMWQAGLALCEQIQGIYIQSDEIPLLLYDCGKPQTDPWFGGQVQKIVSVASSICTGGFIKGLMQNDVELGETLPSFDARAWFIPEHEVANAFLWHQQDATRNSTNSLAQSMFPGKALHGRNISQTQDMLMEMGGQLE